MAVSVYSNMDLKCPALNSNGILDNSDFKNTFIPITNSSNQSSSSGRSTPNNDPAPGKLFVGGLSWLTSSDKLREYFSNFGTVTDVLLMKDPMTQRSRGFAFITFAEPSSVDKVLKVPIHTLDGKKIDPKHATPKNRSRSSSKTKKIFVGGVSQETTSDEVKNYFSQFGKVDEAVMLMDQQTKRHRGFGFVTFENEDIVDRVCDIHYHTIKNKKVECKKAQPKEMVQPANQLLGRRLMIGGLGLRLASSGSSGALTANQMAVVQAAQVQAATAAAIQAQSAAAAAASVSFPKLFTPYTPLSSYRYSPYQIPATVPTALTSTAASGTQNPNPTSPPAATTAATPLAHPTIPAATAYFPNLDMTSIPGIDLNALYSMGLYV